MKKLLLILASIALLATPSKADEGMWLLPFVEKLNIKQMHEKGFKLSAKDIYDINQAALKDAIIIFGGGCTGELISPEGLILTNHHCGYGAIQQHSSVEHDYLKYGFWAEKLSDEIPTPGLKATMIKEIVDVTDQIIPKLKGLDSEKERNEKIEQLSKTIAAKYDNEAEGITSIVRPMFGGNQYILFQTQVFNDVRMVGTPPSSIGKFGGETDNWMWPRHTGDFSMFRIYASPDNKPAAYAQENVPFKPAKHLTISLKGYKDGDYAMIMGFPGRTNRYMTSWEIDQVLSQDNPIRIYIRGERQKLMWEDMLASDKVRIQYSSKYAGSSNYWKNSIGMSRGLRRLDVRSKKDAQQKEFSAWVAADKKRTAKYGKALDMIEQAVKGRMPFMRQSQLISEALLTGVESFRLAGTINRILSTAKGKDTQALQKQLTEASDSFFKDYNQSTDRKISERLMQIYADSTSTNDQPAFFAQVRGNIKGYTDKLFSSSAFVSQDKFNALVAAMDTTAMVADPAMVAARDIRAKAQELDAASAQYSDLFANGHRLWQGGLLEMNEGKKSLYPDANFTLRMTYGQVLPYEPADAVYYNYYTTLSGVMAKEDSTSAEFQVPSKLKELYNAKDFGRYAYKGDVPVALLSNNDITGGNSGSPVLNDKGELIGLAFDGNWEAMSGDIAFEPDVQRTISVDIRYVLFIIDKFAGAQRLIDEMTIVE